MSLSLVLRESATARRGATRVGVTRESRESHVMESGCHVRTSSTISALAARAPYVRLAPTYLVSANLHTQAS